MSRDSDTTLNTDVDTQPDTKADTKVGIEHGMKMQLSASTHDCQILYSMLAPPCSVPTVDQRFHQSI